MSGFASKMVLVVLCQITNILEIGSPSSCNGSSSEDVDLVLESMVVAEDVYLMIQLFLREQGKRIDDTVQGQHCFSKHILVLT